MKKEKINKILSLKYLPTIIVTIVLYYILSKRLFFLHEKDCLHLIILYSFLISSLLLTLIFPFSFSLNFLKFIKKNINNFIFSFLTAFISSLIFIVYIIVGITIKEVKILMIFSLSSITFYISNFLNIILINLKD